MANSPKTEESHIGAFRPDPNNARKHTPRNVDMIERSLNDLGAGRSILVAKDGTVLAGNATIDAAAAAGIHDVIVVHTDGTKLVVVQRDDLESTDPRATKLALVDNRAAELAEWDVQMLSHLSIEFAEDPSFNIIFREDELATMFEGLPARGDDAEESEPLDLPDPKYTVVVECRNEDDQEAFMAFLDSEGRTYKARVD